MISNLKIRYSIFLEEPNKTCDSSNPSPTTTSIQPNLESSHSSTDVSSSPSDSAQAAADPDGGERASQTPVSVQEEIGKSALHPFKGACSYFYFYFFKF